LLQWAKFSQQESVIQRVRMTLLTTTMMSSPIVCERKNMRLTVTMKLMVI
jgi:hypothetical protein